MIRLLKSTPALVLAACAAAALPAHAESSIASSASDSISTTFGKLSDSLSNSSTSSSPGDHQAKGDYKVIDVAEAEGRPGMLRLRLQPFPEGRADGEVQLVLPREAAEAGHVARDAIVTAFERPYGVEFAAGAKHEAFFLALADDWMRELKTNVVTVGS
jgi:hypothetical protein